MTERYSARLVYSHAVHVAGCNTMLPFALISRCSQVASTPFSLLGRSFLFHQRQCSSPSPGSVRTATKRAGGTVRNHGGSPGKRLGLKKFSGSAAPQVGVFHADRHRSICRPWQHNYPPTRDTIPPWTTRMPSVLRLTTYSLAVGRNGS